MAEQEQVLSLLFQEGDFFPGWCVPSDAQAVPPASDLEVCENLFYSPEISGDVAVETLRYAATLAQEVLLLLHDYIMGLDLDNDGSMSLFCGADNEFDPRWQELAVAAGGKLAHAIGRIVSVSIPFERRTLADMAFEFYLMAQECSMPDEEWQQMYVQVSQSCLDLSDPDTDWDSTFRFGLGFGPRCEMAAERLERCRTSGLIKVDPFPSLKSVLVGSGDDQPGSCFFRGPMGFPWDGRVITAAIKLMRHHYNREKGGRQFAELLEALVGKHVRVPTDEEIQEEAMEEQNHVKYLDEGGELSINEWLDSKRARDGRDWELQISHAALLEQLQSCMQGMPEESPTSCPEFYERSINLQSPPVRPPVLPAALPPLPDGWVTGTDAEGKVYYLHPEKPARWDHPAVQAVVQAEPGPEIIVEQLRAARENRELKVHSWLCSYSGMAAPDELPEGWAAVETHDGRVYYVNSNTQAISWEFPKHFPS